MCFSNGATGATSEDYARAERFLSWNKDRYVINADIQHSWVGGEDRFWYLRTGPSGEKQFVLVDAAGGTKAPAFDHRKIADALSRATGDRVEAARLPFSSFRYERNQGAIQFYLAGSLWTCRMVEWKCTESSLREAGEAISPNGQWATFLRNHNLWVRRISSGAEFPLTTDGTKDYGYADSPGYSGHAVSDIRHSRATKPQVVWSPDSRFLITHRLDERQVGVSYLVQSVPEDGSVRPKLHAYRYALPGDEHLPLIEPVVIDVLSRRRIELATAPLICSPLTLIERRDTWWSADSKTVYYLDRDRFSKSVALVRAGITTGVLTTVLREASHVAVRTNADNLLDPPLVRTLTNGDVIWYSERDGWGGHLYYYDSAGALRNRVTQGSWVVRSIVRIDESKGRIYFMASGHEDQHDPYEQRLYSVQFDGSEIRLLTPEMGEHEWPYRAFKQSPETSLSTDEEHGRFSMSGRYFLDTYSRPDSPPVLVLRDSEGRLIMRLEQADISRLLQGGYTPIEPFQVKAADGKTWIYGNLFRPSAFDPGRKYPVIDSVYPGPNSRRTRKRFTAATFDEFEAQSLAELGFIVVTIDGRGTPNRSRAFMDHSAERLDRASDLQDHIAAIRQLARRYPYLDLERVGVDGASAGGYAAAHAVLRYPEFFRVAVAAEGNHDQRGYLASWGEAYGGMVNENSYEAASNLPLAGNLKGKLLLMHGELDDNVSPSLTIKLVDALIKANKDFDLLILPNGNHLAWKSPYFIRRKWDYFVRNLLGAEVPDTFSITQPH
jgi:dipeptidyl-peptidase 4